MVYKCFDKKSKGSGVNTHTNNEIKQNQHPLDTAAYQLAQELHKPNIRKFTKRTVYSGHKDMSSISKNVYIEKLDDMVNEYNNIYHRTIKMKPVDVKDNTYTDFKKKVNDKDPKFEVGDHVRISKYKNIFAKGYTPNQSEKVFVIKKVKNTIS